MNLVNCVWFFVLVLSAETAKRRKNCQQCIPVQDCNTLDGLSRVQQQQWYENYSCQTSQEDNDDEVSFLFGFAPFAKGDYVCCPDSSVNNNQPQTHENIQKPNQRPSYSDNGGSGFDTTTPDFENKFGNSNRRPSSQQRPNNNIGNNWGSTNQNRPSGSFNQRPSNQYNGNNFGNNRRPNGNWENDGLIFERPENNYGNQRPHTHENQNQGLPNSNFGNNNWSQGNNRRPTNRRPNQIPQTENPYFMGRTTTRRPNNIDNGSNRRIGDAGVNVEGQCQALTSIPPTMDSGCCGRDASDEEDRIIASERPNTFAPASNNQYPWRSDSDTVQSAPSSNWPRWLPSFNFFSDDDDDKNKDERMKRDVGNQSEVVNITLDNRIAGGKATTIGQFPWLVLLKSIFDYGSKLQAFNCGGSLISATYVLTAGHCVYDTEASLSDVEITLAEYDKRTFPNDCTNDEDGRRCIKNVRVYAADVIRHPEYDDTRLQNDIALIRLRSRAPYTEFIRPICLPPIDIDNPQFSNLPLHISGWGRNGIYNSNVKQSTVVNLVPQRECKRSYSFLTRRHVCAAGYSGEDTCKGDSGGPLMLFYEGKYFVSGVVSGKRADSPCGTSVPSLYTNVYHYLDWIKSNIRN